LLRILFTLLCTSFLAVPLSLAQTNGTIHIDQFGYYPFAPKVAVISNPVNGFNAAGNFSPTASYQIRSAQTDEVVFEASLTAWNNGQIHDQSGDKVWWFDFSSLEKEGTYYVYDAQNDLSSYPFRIGNDVYDDVLRLAVRTFLYQRSGFKKESPYVAAEYADEASHSQDLTSRFVRDPGNAATEKDLSGGWYDAGDYNKYVNFTYTVLHELLAAYEAYPEAFGDDWNIPESGNGTPDILDEIKWELDWLLKMQQTDGSVLAKVSVTDFSSASPPSADNNSRYYGEATSSSTRSVCSIFAHAARVFRSLSGNQQMTAYGNTLLAKSELAWDWLKANPAYSTYDNGGFSSATPEINAYEQQMREFSASVYLYSITDEQEYLTFAESNYSAAQPYQWTYWYAFESQTQDALLELTRQDGVSSDVSTNIKGNFIMSMNLNNNELLPSALGEKDAYRAYMKDGDYVWGSNSVKARMGNIYLNMLMYELYEENNVYYTEAASGYLHYMHGVNPLNLTYLTSMQEAGAENSIKEIYHAWFGDGTQWDNADVTTYGPPPGYLSGGPNVNFSPEQGYLAPPQDQPAQKSYRDWNTSWPQNSWELTEPAIYYQASYIKLLAQYMRVQPQGVTTSIGPELEEEQFSIYPNPSTGEIQLASSLGFEQEAQVNIFSLEGKLLRKDPLPVGAKAHTLDLSNLGAGFYIINLQTAGRTASKKIIIL
ncbi:MAG: glycoside hydrolase family 9 protein, partial [Bacteroidota bacterium]